MTEPAAAAVFDVEAEKAVLGAMLLSREVIGDIEAILTPAAFYRPAHGTVFDAITREYAAGNPTDAVAITGVLTDNGAIGRIGGMTYLHELVKAVPTAANGPYYARTVADRALRRELDATARRIQQLVAESNGPASELLDRAQQMLTTVDPGTADDDGSRLWGDIIPEALEAIEQAADHDGQTPGIPTGLIDLDRLLDGLRPGQLVVIAARPGIGKTVLAAQIAQHASWRHKLSSLMFSLEMTRLELAMRLLSAESGVPLKTIQTGQLDDTAWTKVTRVAGESADAPLRIDDNPNLTLADIRARSRRHHRRDGGLALITVDYLQLVSTPKSENRQVAVSTLTRGLKLLAKELEVPLVVVAQLNRGPEHRTDKRPQLSDLRESGAIEQDADVVILVHRDDYYDKESPRAGEADLIVDKNRGGATDTVTVASQLHLARFASFANEAG